MAWPLEATKQLALDDYTVAWVCALPIEKTAARNMLDELHISPLQPEHDKNIYTFGRICRHNVVIVCQGDMGTTAASVVTTRMETTFRKLRFGLLVGIAGGVPDKKDVRLGDVVVSKGDGRFGGMVAYDRGKETHRGFEPRPLLDSVPELMRNAIVELESRLMDHDSKIAEYISKATARNSRFSDFGRPASLVDNLFKSEYIHVNPNDKICAECNKDYVMARAPRGSPLVHFGLVASGNQVIKHAAKRRKILETYPGVIAIEMEAAGLTSVFGFATVRGICDYADSHKNDGWHNYASAVAAAIAKEVLSIIPPPMAVATTRTVDEAIKDKEGQTGSTHPISTLPFEKDDNFVGREGIIAEIEKRISSRHRVAIAGIGGVGKSQIAIEYCYRFQAKNPYSSVLWVHAGTAARFQEAYKTIGRKLGLPGLDNPNVNTYQLICDWLSDERHGAWLMVLDNADDIETFFATTLEASLVAGRQQSSLLAYIPRSPNGNIIVTTRDTRVGERLTDRDKCIMVPPLTEQEAERLLRSKLSEGHDWVEAKAASLAKTLDYLPLAITQAAAFISENYCTVADYLEALQASDSNEIKLLNEDLPDPRRDLDAPSSVVRTWKLSFDLVQKRKPRAAEMLSLAAVLDRQGIPKSLLHKDGDQIIDFTTALGMLQSFSLINVEKGGETFAMHRLVQLCMQSWLEIENVRQLYKNDAVGILSRRFPTGKHENWTMCELLLPHARRVLGYTYTSKDGQLCYASLCQNTSWYDWSQGRYKSAFEAAQVAYSVRQKLLGDLDSASLASLVMLALVLRDQGKYEEAEAMNRRALDGREKVLGKEHPDTLTSVSSLASVLQHQGKYEEAEAMNRRALDGSQKVLGKEHPDTLTSVSNLASVLQDQGKYEEAEAMNRRALDGSQKVLGKEHPDTLTSVSNLASVLQDQGKYEEAEAMNRRALDGYQKVLGKEHPYTLTSVSNLALVLQHQGKYEEAEAMNRRALDGREKVLGKEHPDTLTSVSSLALVLQHQGKYEEAEAMNRRALDGREKVLGKEHPDTLTSANNLASVLQHQGKYEEAEAMNRRALDG